MKMDSFLERPTTYYITGGVVATCLTCLIVKKLMSSRAARNRAEKRKNYPANTVILHHIGGWAPYAPSLSPYPLKLETYLRMAKIPYQNEHGLEFSAKGKTPWITYNGEDIADSQFCIEFLNGTFNKDLSGHLSKEQKAIAYSIRKLTEESLYWVLVIERWTHNEDNYKFLKLAIPLPSFMFPRLAKNIQKQAQGQGYGRHTKEEVRSIGRQCLQALSDFLGTKPFLMGDQPCEEDCAVFGMLAQFYWQALDTVYYSMITDEFRNLSEYCDRMKEHLWPDWDECNTAGGTRNNIKWS